MLRSPTVAGPEPCRASTLVLDFDGTLTDADAHAPRFWEASRRELASRLGWDEATLSREWPRAYVAVTRLPSNAAWVVDGHGVCPSNADPYLTANSVTQRLLSEHRPGLDGAAITALVLDVHRASYLRVPPLFRPEARAVLEALSGADYRVNVVTNTDTETVARLLDSLAFEGRETVVVRGGASKFSICDSASNDARFESLPETVAWPGLDRPLHLRRGKYFDLLRAVWSESGEPPESTLVVGDVFELDLAMPAALGAHVHLVTRASTMPHEIDLARRMARGDASAPLTAVLERLRG